jgi:hypothetical protein
MPEQTVKHDNTTSGFLLVLIPVAFFAVFLSVAWPFIVGAALLFTGNNVWQSYQLSQLSQQVNPLFNELIIEKQGSITPLELSVRANISGKIANRYLHGKAVEFGGTSQQSASQGVIYNFLTVSSLENVFTGINPNPTATQKLAEFDLPAVPVVVQLLPAQLTPPSIAQPLASTSIVPPSPITVESKTSPVLEVAVAPPISTVPETELVLPVTSEPVAETEVVIESVIPEITVELVTEPVVESLTNTAVQQLVDTAPSVTTEPMPVSSFGQALRNIFNAENSEVEEEQLAVAPAISSVSMPEIISQADLAKRLDVHASTIYKRRSDVSFAEWTRNRDPEGIAWGYAKDSKEFYRLG